MSSTPEAVTVALPLNDLVFKQAPVGLVVADPTGRIVRTNQALLDLLGYDEEEVIDLHYFDLLHPGHHEKELGLFTDLVARRRRWYAVDERAVTRSGDYHWIHARVSLLRDPEGDQAADGGAGPSRVLEGLTDGGPAPEGDPPCVIAVILDIAQRKALEQEVMERRRLDVLAQLTGGVAHDFNNLLTIIRGELELLAGAAPVRDLPQDESEAGLHNALDATERAAALTRSMLAFGRQQVLRTEVVDLNDLLRRNEDVLRRVMSEDRPLRLELTSSLPQVDADPGQLLEVALNLLLNAHEASPSGAPIRLRTATRPHRDEPGEETGTMDVLFEVIDCGTGISRENLDHIFEPFYSTREGRTGLGLSTTHGIVNQSGGDLEVESDQGQGSTFRVVLPSTTEIRSPARETPGDAPPDRAVILVIEDEPMVRSVTRRALSQKGHRILEAATAQEAVDALRRHQDAVDLVLSDVVLPGSNSIDLWAEIRSLLPATPVILMSGYARDLIEERIPPGEVRWFLEKPFTLTRLGDIVHAALTSG